MTELVELFFFVLSFFIIFFLTAVTVIDICVLITLSLTKHSSFQFCVLILLKMKQRHKAESKK